jgi:formylglycine-generating enzyme required for sulfatase activity
VAGVFTRGDVLTCTVTPFDGTDTGTPVSTSITISNGLPTVDSISLTETELFTNSTITVVATGSDPDGDAVTLNYQWLVDGQAVAETSATLDGSLYFSKHQTVQAVVTANDTFDNGNAVYSNSITVQNSLPSGLVVTIDPIEADVDRDDLLCSITAPATDADGDLVTYSFSWDVTNSLIYNGPYTGALFTSVYDGDMIPSSETDTGEYWTCSVVPSDGEASALAATDDVHVVYNYFDIQVVAGGSFTMGSATAEIGRISGREDSHDVTLSRDIRVMRHEVTQAEFHDLMGYDPSVFTGCADCPVENVSWHEAAALANEASVEEGHAICYTCTGSGSSVVCSAPTDIYSCTGYRLPTDAEWEYLARAGTVSAYNNGGSLLDGTQTSCTPSIILSNGEDLANVGYFCGNSQGSTQPVGGLDENAFSLYDMHGNVQEWTNDWYIGPLGTGNVTDPTGALSGTTKVLRGGAWSLQPTTLRSANRAYMTPATRQSYVGVRLLRTQ